MSSHRIDHAVSELMLERATSRPCPRCGAATGETCVTANGNKVTDVGDIHSARLRSAPVKVRREE